MAQAEQLHTPEQSEIISPQTIETTAMAIHTLLHLPPSEFARNAFLLDGKTGTVAVWNSPQDVETEAFAERILTYQEQLRKMDGKLSLALSRAQSYQSVPFSRGTPRHEQQTRRKGVQRNQQGQIDALIGQITATQARMIQDTFNGSISIGHISVFVPTLTISDLRRDAGVTGLYDDVALAQQASGPDGGNDQKKRGKLGHAAVNLFTATTLISGEIASAFHQEQKGLQPPITIQARDGQITVEGVPLQQRVYLPFMATGVNTPPAVQEQQGQQELIISNPEAISPPGMNTRTPKTVDTTPPPSTEPRAHIFYLGRNSSNQPERLYVQAVDLSAANQTQLDTRSAARELALNFFYNGRIRALGEPVFNAMRGEVLIPLQHYKTPAIGRYNTETGEFTVIPLIDAGDKFDYSSLNVEWVGNGENKFFLTWSEDDSKGNSRVYSRLYVNDQPVGEKPMVLLNSANTRLRNVRIKVKDSETLIVQSVDQRWFNDQDTILQVIKLIGNQIELTDTQRVLHVQGNDDPSVVINDDGYLIVYNTVAGRHLVYKIVKVTEDGQLSRAATDPDGTLYSTTQQFVESPIVTTDLLFIVHPKQPVGTEGTIQAVHRGQLVGPAKKVDLPSQVDIARIGGRRGPSVAVFIKEVYPNPQDIRVSSRHVTHIMAIH